jgi:hypothetical protein
MTFPQVERVDLNALEPLEVKRFHLAFQGWRSCTGGSSVKVPQFTVAESGAGFQSAAVKGAGQDACATKGWIVGIFP